MTTLLKPEDVGEMLGLTLPTLASWRSRGVPNLPFCRIGGRVRYRLSDIERFISERMKGSEAVSSVESPKQ